MSNGFQCDPYFPDFKSECIIAKKVYAQCQQRHCFEGLAIPLPVDCTEFEFVSIRFNPGQIVEGSLIITPLPSRPNFSRVRFKVLVTFVVKLRNSDTGKIIEVIGELPEIQKDIVMFIPEARDEFTFKIVLETASQLLTEPFITQDQIILAIGVFMIIKVVGVVQLFIPAFGFCPEPPECEEFFPDDICEDFDDAPFPEFFPRQLEDLDL